MSGMKFKMYYRILIVAVSALFLAICGQKAVKAENNHKVKIVDDPSLFLVKDSFNSDVDDQKEILPPNLSKYLITDSTVGYFLLGNAWRYVAKTSYQYDFLQSCAGSFDGSCEGGFGIGRNLKLNESNVCENADLVIGADIYYGGWGSSTDSNLFKGNPNTFFVASDNNNSWYWVDKIGYIVVQSEKFKIKEGIGVGSTIRDVEQIFGEFMINFWAGDGGTEVNFRLKSYKNVVFLLDEHDFKNIDEYAANTPVSSKSIKENKTIRKIILIDQGN